MTQNRFRDQFFAGIPRYRWLETLGRGGMGIVYKAMDLELDDVVAIKVLQPDFDGSELDLLTRFKREINLNRKIKHPNVARIHDFGASGDYPYITMEFIAGGDLKALIGEKGRIAAGDAVPILRQIARGTHAAHEMGIIHRDLKPQNVMVDETGAVAILDFGLARGKLNTALTAQSVVLGTPHYISPEQALGNPADARSDVYAIGIIAFEMLTGQLPFVGDTPVATAMKQVTDPVPETLSKYGDVSPELRALVHRCLSKRPEERFQTAAELEMELALLELAPLIPGGPVAAAAGSDAEFDERIGRALDAVVSRPAGGASLPSPARAAAAPQQVFLDAAATATPRVPHRFGLRRAIAAGPATAAPAPPERVPSGAGAQAIPTTAAPTGTADTIVRRRPPAVLIVDSDPGGLPSAAQPLDETGCRTSVARTGAEALGILTTRTIDLVVMEAALPGMDGFDVTRVLKAQPELADVPVLLASARVDRKIYSFGLSVGAADVIRKPAAPSYIVWRAWQLLGRSGFRPPPGVILQPPAGSPLPGS